MVCVVALLGAFVVDLLTPQAFVAAILLDTPIVLSSLGGSRRFTAGLVVAALLANVTAGYVNGIVDHFHWDAIGIGDRILAGLSIVFVGYLGTAVQDEGQRAGRSEELAQRAHREAELGAAIERVRTSLSEDLIVPAIEREATALLAGTSTFFVPASNARSLPALGSLVARTLDLGDVVAVRESDAFGRTVLEELRAPAALALPIVDGERRFGVAIVLTRDATIADETVTLASAFARQAAGALAQARLFAQLAERNAALEERNAVIRDLVYALSHDLRTPLSALAMTMRQAAAGDYGALPEPYRAILEHSIVATDDVARLAETLLLVARFESGEHRPERQPVDLDELAGQIVAEFAAMAGVAKITLRVAGTAPLVIGDRADIRRALTNLVANALAHTPQGGTVTVALADEGAQSVVRVIDDGFGIDPGARAQLFARFAPGAGRRGGGTGLGLYIVRRVAEAAGGAAAFEPNLPRGSTFSIRLPNGT